MVEIKDAEELRPEDVPLLRTDAEHEQARALVKKMNDTLRALGGVEVTVDTDRVAYAVAHHFREMDWLVEMRGHVIAVRDPRLRWAS